MGDVKELEKHSMQQPMFCGGESLESHGNWSGL